MKRILISHIFFLPPEIINPILAKTPSVYTSWLKFEPLFAILLESKPFR